MFADVDDSANTLNKMIRNAQIGQWSFVMGASFLVFPCLIPMEEKLTFCLVVGQKEMEDEAVNIRNRDDEVQGREETVQLKDAVAKLLKLKESRSSVAKLE